MGKLQPRSEFYVRKALKSPGSNGEAHIKPALETLSFDAPDVASSSNKMVVPKSRPQCRSTQTNPNTPAWCYYAFQFEKLRSKRERTDWEFVVPVWIAITLFCTLVQIVGFKTIVSVL